MFEFVQEALDLVALLVKIGVVWTLDLAIAFRWDDDFGSGVCNPVAQMVGIVTFVGQNGSGLETVDKIMSKGDVIALSRTGNQADRKAKRFRRSMDFRRQSAARPTQALGIRPPFD